MDVNGFNTKKANRCRKENDISYLAKHWHIIFNVAHNHVAFAVLGSTDFCIPNSDEDGKQSEVYLSKTIP